MKKLIWLTLAIAMAADIHTAHARAGINIITSTEDLAALVREVGGDKVSVEALAKGYQDPHFVEAKPSFVIKLHSADLLVVVGRELEIGWLPPLITQSRNAKIQPGGQGYLDASLTARILDMPTGQITRAMGDVHPQGNPHYWLDPRNGRLIAKAIQDKLAAMSTGDTRVLRAALRRLRPSALGRGEALAGGDGALQGTEDRDLPSLMAELCRSVWTRRGRLRGAEAGDPAVAGASARAHPGDEAPGGQDHSVEPYFDLQTPNKISRDTGAKVLVMPPSVGGVKEVQTYLQLFDYDVNLLVSAIKRDRSDPVMGDLTVWQIAEFLAAPFAASLILTGYPRLSRASTSSREASSSSTSRSRRLRRSAPQSPCCMPLLGGDPHGRSVYWVSLAFTFIGAAIFALIRTKRARIPQEAIIGISYAVASAAAILAMSKSTSQAEHLKDMLVGNIIAVSWHDVFKTAGLYGAVGLFHYVYRKQFLAISMNHEQAEADRPQRPAVGLPVLRVVRLRGHLVGVDRRRPAGVLLPHRSVGRRHALRRGHRSAPRHRLDDGHDRVGARRVPVARPRSADRRDDRSAPSASSSS